MQMDETRKRQLIAGIVLGAVTVGVVVLLKNTPREKWGDTFGKIAKDALGLAKVRYGNNELMRLAERTVNKVIESA